MPAIPKNTQQDFSIELRDIFGTLDTATTGAPTVNLCKDGTWAVATNAATNTKAGYWKVTLTAAEMNFREVVLEAVKTGFVTFSRTFYPEPDYTPTKATYLDSALSTIQADTDNIQTRLPAALVSGRMDASVGAIAAGAITAAAIATDAIDADALAANAVTEIQSGLSTIAAADVWAYAIRTLTGGTVTVTSPAVSASRIEMLAGYDYTDNAGQSLQWAFTDAPDLTGATVDIVKVDTSETSYGWTVTVSGAGTATQTVKAEVTSAMTLALATAGQKVTLAFRIKATLSNGAQRVLAEGVMTIS